MHGQILILVSSNLTFSFCCFTFYFARESPLVLFDNIFANIAIDDFRKHFCFSACTNSFLYILLTTAFKEGVNRNIRWTSLHLPKSSGGD